MAVLEFDEAISVPHKRSNVAVGDNLDDHPRLDRNLGEHGWGALSPKVSEHIVRIAVFGHRSRLSGAAELLAEARRLDARLPTDCARGEMCVRRERSRQNAIPAADETPTPAPILARTMSTTSA
jgi:hypothetical protein